MEYSQIEAYTGRRGNARISDPKMDEIKRGFKVASDKELTDLFQKLSKERIRSAFPYLIEEMLGCTAIEQRKRA